LATLDLDSRLTGRLCSGLVVPLRLPSVATRRVIIRQLCEQRQIHLTPEAQRILSEVPDVTVPQLMGLISQLHHHRIGAGDGTTIEAVDVQRLLQATSISRMVDAKELIRTAARYFGLQPRNLTGSSRRKMDVLARSQAMFLIRELTGSSFQQIGQDFGGRDHTTVMHACNKVAKQQQADSAIRHALQEIRRQLSVSGKQSEPG
jgi:chromosomal replication initiator protein